MGDDATDLVWDAYFTTIAVKFLGVRPDAVEVEAVRLQDRLGGPFVCVVAEPGDGRRFVCMVGGRAWGCGEGHFAREYARLTQGRGVLRNLRRAWQFVRHARRTSPGDVAAIAESMRRKGFEVDEAAVRELEAMYATARLRR